MDSYSQIRGAERTTWFTSQEVRNITDMAAMVTEALNTAGGEGKTLVQTPADHGEISLRPISADHFSAQMRDLFCGSPGKFLAGLDLKDDTLYCVSWVPQGEYCITVSGVISRLLGVCELVMAERLEKYLDLDRLYNEIWGRLHASLMTPRMERQSERWGPRDRPEIGCGVLYKRTADLVVTYEKLLLVPDETRVTHYLRDLGIHVFRYNAAQEQIQDAYEKTLSVMEVDDAESQIEEQLVHRGEIISAMQDRLLIRELKPGGTVLFIGTEPCDDPGDSELRGDIVEAVNPSERICSIRSKLLTIHDVPLHCVLGRYDVSVEGEHYDFPHVRPLFGENRGLTGQYLQEAEADWSVRQTETQIDAPQMMQEEASETQKTEITLSFDGEGLGALESYLKKENTTIQKHMNRALMELYGRIAPKAVWEFLSHKTPQPARPRRPTRPGVEKPPEKAPRPEG